MYGSLFHVLHIITFKRFILSIKYVHGIKCWASLASALVTLLLVLAVSPQRVWSCFANVATVPLLPCLCLPTETLSLGTPSVFSILGIQTKLWVDSENSDTLTQLCTRRSDLTLGLYNAIFCTHPVRAAISGDMGLGDQEGKSNISDTSVQ